MGQSPLPTDVAMTLKVAGAFSALSTMLEPSAPMDAVAFNTEPSWPYMAGYPQL
jgi:hypothetical protein